MTKKDWNLCLVGINFRESAKKILCDHLISRIKGVIREICEILWTRNFLILK